MALPDFFGLDFGHNSVKLAEIKMENNSATIVKLSSSSVSGNLIDDDTEIGINNTAEELKKAYKASGIKTKNCVMSVPEVSIFSRLITIPAVKDEEITETIHWSLKPLIPIAIDKVNISFLKIDDIKINNKDYQNWYVVAAPKNLVERMQSITTKAGLNLLAVETEALAVARMATFNESMQGDVMIVDMGAESTNVILARNGVVTFSQIINTGSEAITKVIAADYGIDMVQAEKYKTTFGLDASQGDGKIAKAIEPIMQIVLGEISRTVTYFNERISTQNSISKVFLTGGAAKLPALDKYLSEKLSIETKLIELNTNRFKLSSEVKNELNQLNINSFSVSIGLGLKTENN